jgi:hypothetical protein
MQSMIRIRDERREKEGKGTRFRVRGRKVASQKIQRYEHRHADASGQSSSGGKQTESSDVAYSTPSEGEVEDYPGYVV